MSATATTSRRRSRDPYADLLRRKRIVDPPRGFEVTIDSEHLFPFQREVVRWAVHRGRAAIFADTGLGKTRMQLAWAEAISEQAGGIEVSAPVLLLAPLGVGAQTVAEAKLMGIEAARAVDGPTGARIDVTNYERLHHFDPSKYGALVLDESSILRDFSGKVRTRIQAWADEVPYRLACTATPAPNELLELTNHSEFVGAMRGVEMLSLFFTVDKGATAGKQSYRLKGHAERDFYEWMASWSVAMRKPSDLGDYADDGYELPPLDVRPITVEAMTDPGDRLFALEARTLGERRGARKASMPERVARIAELVLAEPDEPWIVWCDLNDEADALRKAIPEAVEVRGSDTIEHKESTLGAFSAGGVRVLITKPSIAGHGLNWQHCARVAFAGMSDSWEQRYQAIRRCWRFGQSRPVVVYTATAEDEQAVVANVARKDAQAARMMDGMIAASGRAREEIEMPHTRDLAEGEGWRFHLGDSAEIVPELEPESIDLAVFSPPFPGMYVYSNTPRDVGNAREIHELVEHGRFMMGAPLLRAMVPGRICAVHLMHLPAYETRDGYAGIRDFRGPVIEMMTEEGWEHAGEVTIDKNPQLQATRHKEHSLLFKTLSTDASRLRPALADYLLIFRAPGDNPKPIKAGIHPDYNPTGGWVSQEDWIEWAAPVWYRQQPGISGGIRETDVLNVTAAREGQDERHLAPLQLGVIRRMVLLYTNPGELVFSPFGGIASEGVVALREGRRYQGIELKPSYWRTGIANLRGISEQPTLEASAA